MRKRKRGRAARLILLALLALALVVYVQTWTVRVEYADVYLSDLPAAFDGFTLLFVSDLHVGGIHSARATRALFENLQTLYPDALLLGGDYPADDLLTTLGDAFRGQKAGQRKNEDLTEFFTGLKNFYAPYGKYAVAGNHDVPDTLEPLLQKGEVMLLNNQAVRLYKGDSSILLAGLGDYTTGASDVPGIAGARDDCSIVLTHNPSVFPVALSQPGRDAGAWVDLMLAGHTHGGQIRLWGLEGLLRRYLPDLRYLSGWYSQDGALLLVTDGVGAVGVPVRLGAPAQAHLLTLHRKSP